MNAGLIPSLFMSDVEQNLLVTLLKPNAIFLDVVNAKYAFAKVYIKTLQRMKQT